MTTEANDNDPSVSEAYRNIATETTPPELDSKILSMAADSRRSTPGLSRRWFRPIAWAATIGLSLAFVLELSELNNVAEPTIENDADAILEERVLGDQVAAEPGETSRLQMLQQEVDKRVDSAAEAKASQAPAAAERTPAAAFAPPDTASPAAGAVSVSEDFAADDMHLLREAEDQARARSGPVRAVSADAESVAAFAVKKEKTQHCDAEARLTAATWYECIEVLREQELTSAATLELEALFLDFPDFQIPDANR
jgi:hypothetical protein